MSAILLLFVLGKVRVIKTEDSQIVVLVEPLQFKEGNVVHVVLELGLDRADERENHHNDDDPVLEGKQRLQQCKEKHKAAVHHQDLLKHLKQVASYELTNRRPHLRVQLAVKH